MIAHVTSDCTKGFCFCEVDETHQSLIIHITQVKDDRCLHTGDRISLDTVPNPERPGQMMGGNVVYLGHTIAVLRAAQKTGV